MEPIHALILGVIQGLTEFLPISSSGHLVIFQNLFGLEEPELFFDVCVHIGTLASVIFFFRREIVSIVASILRFIGMLFSGKASAGQMMEEPDLKMALLIIVGSVPTAVLGLLFNEIAEKLFSSIALVGLALIATGILLWITRGIKTPGRTIERFSMKDALAIGFTQGLAIIPGVSRSGSTISIGLLLGLDRETAARFSFLLSIPAILGAALLTALKIQPDALLPWKVTLMGTAASCLVGYAALRFLVHIVKRGGMHLFAPYCWVVGILAVVAGW